MDSSSRPEPMRTAAGAVAAGAPSAIAWRHATALQPPSWAGGLAPARDLEVDA